MLDRRRRVARVIRGVSGILDPDETITAVVQASAGTGSTDDVLIDNMPFTATFRARFYALIATDRSVYAVALPSAVSNRPDGVLFKWPLEKVSARRAGTRFYLRLVEDPPKPERGFELLPLFRKRADQFAECVNRDH